jgi:hypothetical protein
MLAGQPESELRAETLAGQAGNFVVDGEAYAVHLCIAAHTVCVVAHCNPLTFVRLTGPVPC